MGTKKIAKAIGISVVSVVILWGAWRVVLRFTGLGDRDACISGSWRESGKVHVLRGFLKSDEFGSRGGQALGFQQQVVEVAIAASAA